MDRDYQREESIEASFTTDGGSDHHSDPIRDAARGMTPGYLRIRHAAGVIDTASTQSIIKIEGASAGDVLDRALPGKVMFLQPQCAMIATILDENLRIIDIATLINLDDHYLMSVSRSAKEAVIAFLKGHADENCSITQADDQWTTIAIEGPFAWKSAKELAGPEVAGLRFLNMLDFQSESGRAYCLRVSQTGEYGYRFFVPAADAKAFGEKVDELRGFCASPITEEELKLLAYETRQPIFGITVESGDCPFEMGLRYTIDFRKDTYVYGDRVAQKRESVSRGLVGIQFAEGASPGSEVKLAAEAVGEIRYAGYSPTLRSGFGFALLSRDVAYPGIDAFETEGETIGTRTTPFFNTRSMDVSVE